MRSCFLLLAFSLICFVNANVSNNLGHHWGSPSNNETLAIDTFFNTNTLTKAHFLDKYRNNEGCRLVYRKPIDTDISKPPKLDSFEFQTFRIIIAYRDSIHAAYVDSCQGNIISKETVRLISEAPNQTRILIDKIRVLGYYNGRSDGKIRNLAPLLYEISD